LPVFLYQGACNMLARRQAIAGKCTIIWDQHIELIRSLMGSTFCRKYAGKGRLFAFCSLLAFLSLVACCSHACTISGSLRPRISHMPLPRRNTHLPQPTALLPDTYLQHL
jgi:hypothetical protein